MSDFKNRISHLEDSLGERDYIPETHLDTDSLIRKLGLDPDKVRAVAKEKEQSPAEVIAGDLGIPYGNFQKALRLRAQGKDTS